MQLQFCFTKLNPTSRMDVMSSRISSFDHIFFSIPDVAARKRQQWLDESLIFFTCTILEISKVVDLCSSACIHNKPMLYETYASIAGALSVCCAKWIAKSGEGTDCMTEFSSKQFCWFPGWSADKNNQDFVQPLVVFHYRYSNFCYCEHILLWTENSTGISTLPNSKICSEFTSILEVLQIKFM